MADEWREVTVEEIKAGVANALATGPFGSSISSRFFTDSGVPVIRGSNLSEDVGTRLSDDGLVFVTPEKAGEFSRSIVRNGDLIFTCWGTVNQIGLVDARSRYSEYVISNKQMKLTPDPTKGDSLFLYYLFSSPELQHRIKNQSIGSSVPGFNLGQLRGMRILIPEAEEQRAIAHILGTLDDKIELNRRMSETLETMARALFKSWFVDFDPVRAKMEGRDPGLPKHIADLFPDRLVDSELGEIPEGWEVEPLSQLMTFEGGSQPPASEFIAEPREGYIRLVQIRDFYSISHMTFVPDTHRLRKFSTDDVMIARYGSSGNTKEGGDSLARICRGLSGAYNVALVKVVPSGPHREFLNYFLQSPAFQTTIRGMGARSVQSGFKKADLDVISLASPPPGVLAAFEQFAESVWSRNYQTNQHSDTLAALRDTLLPKLISGEIRLKDANRVAENVVA